MTATNQTPAGRASDLAGNLASRVRRRIGAQAWLLDRARATDSSRRVRLEVERARMARLVRAEGSADAALDAIVRRAVADPPR